MKPRLRALTRIPYGGDVYQRGQEFDAETEKDADILVAIQKAERVIPPLVEQPKDYPADEPSVLTGTLHLPRKRGRPKGSKNRYPTRHMTADDE